MVKTADHRIFRVLTAIAVVLLILALSVSEAYAEVDLSAEYDTENNEWKDWPAGPEIWGKTACLIDWESGTVLYSKGSRAERFPASITKVMTAMVVLDNCDLDGIVTMTETGLADAYAESSNINPSLGEQFTVEQCLQMLLVKSANDIATQLAEYTSGSVEAFAQQMNEKAASLGCTNTHFTNASGLEDDDHYTSAYDMCLIMREAVCYDKIREIMAMLAIEIPPTEYSDARYYTTHVYLIQPDNPYYYEGCIGGKTGYTDVAASTLVCAAQRDGRVLVAAVLGAPDTGTNAEDMVDLFNYGFESFAGVDFSDEPEEKPEETPQATQEPEPETETETDPESAGQEPETVTDEPKETQTAVTTSEPKAEITGIPDSEKNSMPVKTIIYIIIICVLAAAIIALIVVRIRVNNIRNRKNRRKR